MGGTPESDAVFCDLLARTTGAVVISTTYRFAPAHCFPAAIDDIDAIIRYLHLHATRRWGADPELMSVSGSSAGGNLVMAATQQNVCHYPAPTTLKAVVTYYGVMDLRLHPSEKPKPLNMKGEEMMPKNDPLKALFPLMDAYAEQARKNHMDDARFSPMLANLETLPKDVLLIVPGIDILVHEQLTFAERIRGEIEADPEGKGKGRSFEAVVYEKGFHGWTYCKRPSTVLVEGGMLISAVPKFISGPSKMEAIKYGVTSSKMCTRSMDGSEMYDCSIKYVEQNGLAGIQTFGMDLISLLLV
jgi:acetyl esterase/lipase